MSRNDCLLYAAPLGIAIAISHSPAGMASQQPSSLPWAMRDDATLAATGSMAPKPARTLELRELASHWLQDGRALAVMARKPWAVDQTQHQWAKGATAREHAKAHLTEDGL